MLRSISRPLRLLLAVLALGVSVAAMAAPAQATVARSGSLELLPRASWVTYVTRFGGSITTLSGGTLNSSTNVLTVGLGNNLVTTDYNITSSTGGSGYASFLGGIQYQVPAHGIDVKLKDFTVWTASPTSTVAEVYALADYKSIVTGTLTGYTLTHIAYANLSGTFTGVAGPPIRHSWSNAPLTLTTDGALIFNGGTNGSYRAGDAFGSINWWVSL